MYVRLTFAIRGSDPLGQNTSLPLTGAAGYCHTPRGQFASVRSEIKCATKVLEVSQGPERVTRPGS